MSQEVIEVLDHICEKLGIAIDWTSQNIMPQVTDVLHRYANYNIVVSSIWLLIGLIILFVTIFGMHKCLIKGYIESKTKQTDSSFYKFYSYGHEISMNGYGFSVLILGVFMFLISFIMIGCNLTSLLSWIFVPEINIIQTLQGMI